MENISFPARDGIILRGWFFRYPHDPNAPIIIMTPGFSALKEHYLLNFANEFVKNGFHVLIYDQRNFGESEGEPRFEVDPYLQIQDLKDAILYVQTFSNLNATTIGLWGTSFSGGHVIVAAAEDNLVQCVVAQVPFIQGHHVELKEKNPNIWRILQKKYDLDKKNRAQGKTPIMTNVVTDDPTKSAIMKEPTAYTFFTSLPQWVNTVTLRSIQNSGDYLPMSFIDKVSPTPLLMIIADEDTICKTELAIQAFNKALPPKKVLMISGDHFSPYQAEFNNCCKAALAWFKKYLL